MTRAKTTQTQPHRNAGVSLVAKTAKQFVVGEFYSNEDIIGLGVGNAGGIRPSTNPDGSVNRVVLLTAVPSAKNAAENPYHDRIENDILIYTGKGLRGDQEPTGVNKRLIEQLDKRFPIWCFEQGFSRRSKAVGKNRWKFLGLLSLIRYHRESQLDLDGKLRDVWLFEFDIAADIDAVSLDTDAELAPTLFQRSLDKRANDPSEQVVEGAGSESDVDTPIERLRSWLLTQHPQQFEFIVKQALEATGYEGVSVTRYSQDGGIDVEASFGGFGWPVRDWRIQVQAKRWLHTVGRKEVAELRGSLKSDGLGCLITTSHFSKAAIAEATEPGKQPITLVNGREFSRLLSAQGIGPAGPSPEPPEA